MTDVPVWDADAGGPQYHYARMADHIAARIVAGEWQPDARLPGERELSQEYPVALGTVRRALGVLAERGLVVTVPARETFVVRKPELSAPNFLRPARPSAAPSTRRIFCLFSADAAARAATPRGVAGNGSEGPAS